MKKKSEKPTKDSVGKLYYELDWEFVEGLAVRMQMNKSNGKYERFGWKDKGVNIEEMNMALVRHLISIMKGETNDDGQKYGHYYALAANSMLIINSLKNNERKI